MKKNDFNFQDLEKRIMLLEQEVMHLKKAMQYKSQKKSKKD